MKHEMSKPAYAPPQLPGAFCAFHTEAPPCCVRPQLPVNRGLCEDRSRGQMALYPQLTAQGSAHQGLRERSLLHPPDPCVSKAAPEPQPQTGPDLGRRVASVR